MQEQQNGIIPVGTPDKYPLFQVTECNLLQRTYAIMCLNSGRILQIVLIQQWPDVEKQEESYYGHNSQQKRIQGVFPFTATAPQAYKSRV
jgi:hypothetical protein